MAGTKVARAWLGRIICLLLVCGQGLGSAQVAQGATLAEVGFTIKVTTLADEWSTDTNTAPQSKCSLREALQAAMSNVAGNQGCGPTAVSNFESYTLDLPGGTYLLTRKEQLPNISKKIAIDGKDAVTIDGGSKSGRFDGIFIVASGQLELKKLKLQYGQRPFGGAIWSKGGGATLATEVEFFRNLADNGPTTGDGGAVAIDTGSFTCVKSKFIENTARQSGGAISSGGVDVLLDRCEFLRNHAELNGGAYAGFGGSEVTHPILRDVVFEQNWIYQTVVPAGWPGNYQFTDDQSGGGALYNKGYMELERVQFLKNYTDRSKGGGAIYNQGELRMLDIAITDSKAKPSDKVAETLGGAILNDGLLVGRRLSVHGNEARYGALMNRLGGDLFLVNSTVADNLAKSGGGVSNGYSFPLNGGTASNQGGDVYVYHSTLVRANDNATESVSIQNIGNGYFYMANSVTDSLCTGIVSSYGGNIFKTFCSRVPGDFSDDQTATDVIVDNAGVIGLEGLSNNGGANLPKAQFLSVKAGTSGPAVDLGQDKFCSDPALVLQLLLDKDQLNAPRPIGPKCDAGAIEVGTLPPQYYSQDPEGTGFIFPLTVFGKKFSSDHTFLMQNKGGGSLSWQLSFEHNPDGVFSVAADFPLSGALGKDQSVSIPMVCTPDQLGWHDGVMIIKTNLPGKETIRYPISCKMTTDPNNPNSWRSQPPGPVSAGHAAPGGQSTAQVNVGNQGAQPMAATLNWKNLAGDTLKFGGSILGGVNVVHLSGASLQTDFTVPPSGTLQIDITCTPTEPGLFVNTLEIVTNDPVDPLLSYDVSCEGAPPADPERLGAVSLVSLLPREVMGMALSPDGSQLLAGNWGDTNIRVYNISPTSGVPSFQSNFSVAGMGTITGIRYSADGKNVYYTSYDGSGVVAVSRDAGGNLSFIEKVTSTTSTDCGINPCPAINAMSGARALDISPDDLNLYVSGLSDDTLSVLSRDPISGGLSYTQKIPGTLDGSLLLDGPFGVKVSPDGQNVYVAGSTSDTLVAFSRNTETGALKYLSHHKDELNGVTALNGALEIAISPDGRFLYVASRDDGAVQIFARNPADGFLTPAGSLAVANGLYHLLISNDPEGSRLIVAAWTGDAIKVYKRDHETGALTEIEGQASLTPDGPVFLVSSPDDRFVYASLFDGQGIQHLRSLRHTPLVQNLSPASATVGSGDLTLTINGSRFYDSSELFWNGAPLATTLISERRLAAVVPAALLASAGAIELFVRSAPPGGGDSTVLSFTISEVGAAPIPAIESIEPPEVSLSGEPLSVTITGSGFTAQSQALLNGAPVATSYLNPSTLLVELVAGDVTTPGPLAFSVVNEGNALNASLAQAGGTSAPAKFTVAAADTAALPSISSFAPGSLAAGAAEQWLTIYGHNFSDAQEDGSVAYWNGTPRDSVVIDEQTMQLLVSAADLAAASTAQLSVLTPGAGESDRLAFTITPVGQSPVAQVDTAYGEMGASVQLLVSGADFIDGAQVLINGVARPTTWVNEYVLSAAVSAKDLRQGGLVQVVNPGAGPSSSFLLAPQRMLLLPMMRR